MVRLLLLTLFCLSIQTSFSQQYVWADTLQFDADQGITAFVHDQDQNIYVASASSTIGTNLLFTFYCGDVHLRKYNAEGVQIWEKIFQGDARILDMEIDADGNLVVCGGYINALTIDGENYTTPLFVTGSFLMKLDTLGNVLWHKVIVPVLYNNLLYALATDGSSNIYVTGLKNDIEAIFDKYNSAGELIHSEDMLAVRTGSDIELDDDGNIYLAGTAPDYATFDGIHIPPEGTGTGYANFLAKYDSDFNALEVLGTRYFTFDFAPCLAKNSSGVFWRCTELPPVGFSQYNRTIHYDFVSGEMDTIRRVDEAFGIFSQFLQAPDDTTLYLLENAGLTNKILQVNDDGETIDSLIYSGLNCKVELFESDSYNIWTGGYVYDSLVLDTITIFAEEGDNMNPFISRYGPAEEIIDTTITDSCNAYFEYYTDENNITHFTNLSVGSDSSEIESYSWNFCDGSVATEWDPIHVYALPGYVCACLTITDVMGCTDTYCISDDLGIKDRQTTVSIYPNPITDHSLTISSTDPYLIEGIYDITGKSISYETIIIDQEKSGINLIEAQTGIYFLKLNLDGRVEIRKLVVL